MLLRFGIYVDVDRQATERATQAQRLRPFFKSVLRREREASQRRNKSDEQFCAQRSQHTKYHNELKIESKCVYGRYAIAESGKDIRLIQGCRTTAWEFLNIVHLEFLDFSLKMGFYSLRDKFSIES